MADPKSTSPLSLSLTAYERQQTQEALARLDLKARDASVGAIARRILERTAAVPERRCTKVTIRPMAFPVFVGAVRATCCVTLHWLTARPRKHSYERQWMASIAEALAEFPHARMLDDAPCVSPRLSFEKTGHPGSRQTADLTMADAIAPRKTCQSAV